jgi:hypothetical protein
MYQNDNMNKNNYQDSNLINNNLSFDKLQEKNFDDDDKKDDDEAKVEPIHPSEQRGGKKKGLLDTCK